MCLLHARSITQSWCTMCESHVALLPMWNVTHRCIRSMAFINHLQCGLSSEPGMLDTLVFAAPSLTGARMSLSLCSAYVDLLCSETLVLPKQCFQVPCEIIWIPVMVSCDSVCLVISLASENCKLWASECIMHASYEICQLDLGS